MVRPSGRGAAADHSAEPYPAAGHELRTPVDDGGQWTNATPAAAVSAMATTSWYVGTSPAERVSGKIDASRIQMLRGSP
jgi:hypothetical protein